MINIRLADLSEGVKIADMINAALEGESTYLPSKKDGQWWKWKYMDVPFGKPLISVADDGGRIVGAQNCWPWLFTYGGRELRAYEIVDTSVHPDYRGKGLFLKLTTNSVKACNEANADVIFGFPNQNALHGYLKLYYDKVFPVKWWIRVLNPLRIIDSKARRASGKTLNVSDEHRVTEENVAMIRFPNMYERRIQVKSSPEYVMWRYAMHPFYRYGIIFSKDKKSSAVFEIRETVRGYREFIVLEIFGSDRIYEGLIEELVLTAKKYEASMIAVIDPKDFQSSKIFKKKLFLRANNKLFYTVPAKMELEAIVSDIDNWRLIAGLHDAV